MLIPQITFNEANVGVQPILPNVRNRIGIVGQFSRGPANVFAYVNGFTEFASIYGSDAAPGSVGFQVAWDQGARNFGLVRVLGRSQAASGQIIAGGVATKENNIDFRITGVEEPFSELQSTFRMDIETNGTYTGQESGRYVFVVTDETVTSTTIKYKFYNNSQAPTRLDALNLFTAAEQALVTTPAGVTPGEGVLTFDASIVSVPYSEAVENGYNIVFGDTSDTLYFSLGQTFTVKVFSQNYNIPINVGDTAVEIANNLVNVTQGADPLGTVSSSVTYITGTSGNYTTNVNFAFDNDIITGIEGNKYHYFVDLNEPDGFFNISDITWDDNSPLDLITQDPDAALISATDEISFPAGSPLSGTNVTVTSVVEAPVGTWTISTTGGSITGPVGISTGLEIIVNDIDVDGISLSGYQNYNAFTGGTQGPVNAFRDFYSNSGQKLIQIVAISPGAWGNNLNINITTLGNNRWRLDITDPQGQTFNPPIPNESFVIDLTSSQAIDNIGEIEEIKSSNLVRGFFLPKVENTNGFDVNLLTLVPGRLAPAIDAITDTEDIFHVGYFGPNRLQNVSLESGVDGPPLTEEDFVEAIKALDGTNTHIIFAPGIDTSSPLAQAQLVTTAENSSELEGLKIAVLSARPGLKPGAAINETLAINSGRAVMVAGWSTYGGQPSLDRFSASPDSFYSGKLATIGYWVSPAARTTAGTLSNIVEVDTEQYTSAQSLQLYMDARLEVLRPNNQFGGFFLLNGITTDATSAFDKIYVRRTYDIVRQDLYQGLQPYQSEPHTRLLRRQIETSINAYFNTMARNGRIANALPAVCNDSNNPSENYINGNINVTVSFLPLYAADYINISIVRNVASGLTIG